MRRTVVGIGMMLAIGCGAWMARAEDPKKPDGPMPGMPDPATMAEMMKKWMASIEPGPHHKKLEPSVGKWETATRIWMGGPGSEPTVTKGKATIRWVLGGRYLMEETESEMKFPGPDGKMQSVPHNGIGMIGYDNYSNMYEATWTDTMNTAILTMKGGCDPSGKRFTFYGEMDEPMLDIHGRMVKYVTEYVSDDKHVFTIYDLHAADDYKVVEITYTRMK